MDHFQILLLVAILLRASKSRPDRRRNAAYGKFIASREYLLAGKKERKTFSENWFVYYFSSLIILLLIQKLSVVFLWIKIAKYVTRLRGILFLGCFCASDLLFILQGKSPGGSPSLLFQFLAWSQYQFRETKHLMFMIGWSTDSLRLHYYFWKLFKTKCFGFCCLSWQRSVELPAETKMGICCDFLFSYTLKFKSQIHEGGSLRSWRDFARVQRS